MAMVSPEGNPPPSGTSSGCSQHNRRREIQSDERQVRFDARPEQSIQTRTGPLSFDLFAQRLTTQLPKFFSWRPGPEAVAQNWSIIPGRLYAMDTDRESAEQSATGDGVANNSDPCLENTTIDTIYSTIDTSMAQPWYPCIPKSCRQPTSQLTVPEVEPQLAVYGLSQETIFWSRNF